jgi:DNA-binding transcriptional LysR family regulator
MTRTDFDLNLLRVAVAIADSGSVSGAAQILGLSQPATSAALSRLRLRLSDPLFVKTSTGMDPTPRAVSLVATGRTLLTQVDAEIRGREEFNPATTRETFTVALSDIGEMVFLPKILDYFREHAPHASVCSTSPSVDDIDAGMVSGAIDLAIGYFPDVRKNNFYQQRLFTHHFVCLARSGHPSVRDQLTLDQFLSLGHAVVRADGRSQELVEQYLERAGITRQIVVQTPHFMSLPTIIARSDLIATVPHALGLYLEQSTVQVRMLAPPLPFPEFDLKQHWHRKFHREPKNVWFRGVVAALFDDLKDEWREE